MPQVGEILPLEGYVDEGIREQRIGEGRQRVTYEDGIFDHPRQDEEGRQGGNGEDGAEQRLSRAPKLPSDKAERIGHGDGGAIFRRVGSAGEDTDGDEKTGNSFLIPDLQEIEERK